MGTLRSTIFLFLFFTTAFCRAQLSPAEMSVLKTQMVRAVDHARLTDSLFTSLDRMPDKTALLLAYTGTLEALRAKHAWNPYNKMKFVSRAMKTMGKAVSMEPENMEIRFMRFSIEHFTPGFLGFSKDLETDKKEIVKHYRNHNFGAADAALIKNAARFMIESKRCTAEEIKIFQKFL